MKWLYSQDFAESTLGIISRTTKQSALFHCVGVTKTDKDWLVQKASIKEGSSRILWVYNRRGSRYFILVLHCFPINLYNFEFDISDGPKLDKRIYLRLSHPEGAILLPQLENRFIHSIKRQSMILEIQEGCWHVRPWLAKLPRRATLRGLCTEADVYYAWSVRSIVRHHCLLALLSR